MKPVRCDNCKFFYDAEKYDECPHCQTGFKNPSADAVIQPDVSRKINKTNKQSLSKKARAFQEPSVRDIFSDSSMEKKAPQKAAQGNPEAEKSEPQSLRSAINQVANSAQAAQKTVAIYNLPNDNDPVVGWLVCIKGEYIGEGFKLKAGRNNIGRTLSNDIALAKETTVSRERHASVIYEPNKMQFFLQPGESSGLTYLNDDLVMTVAELKIYDKLSLGESSFVFVPLCGENFNWNTYIK